MYPSLLESPVTKFAMNNEDLKLIENILNDPRYAVLFFVLAAWIVACKGVALWKSSRQGQKKWFIAMLVINSFSILELIYLFYFSKPKSLPENNSQETPKV